MNGEEMGMPLAGNGLTLDMSVEMWLPRARGYVVCVGVCDSRYKVGTCVLPC